MKISFHLHLNAITGRKRTSRLHLNALAVKEHKYEKLSEVLLDFFQRSLDFFFVNFCKLNFVDIFFARHNSISNHIGSTDMYIQMAISHQVLGIKQPNKMVLILNLT